MNATLTHEFDPRRFSHLVAKSEVTSHRFFQLIQGDSVVAEPLLKEFMRADYLVARGFAQFLAYLISLTDNARVRVLLVENLWDEHGLGDPDEIHFELYKRLLRSVDVDEPVCDKDQRADFLQLHYDIASKSVTSGIAVFTYANELLSMFEFSKVRSACERVFPTVDKRYFETNQKADIVHTKQLEAVLSKLLLSKELEDEAYESTRSALASRAKFYDAVISAVGA